ncbi:MAG: hypothetical protein ACI8V2_004824 [Candidatus Latescibacterota bacterium]|jgi:hypothetical protein
MIDVFKVADILIEHVKHHYAQDIAIVACYGSYVHGTAHAKSDLDFFFIPETEDAIHASCQFILEDIGFDFWPVRWTRAERMAEFDDPLVSLIAGGHILYARSESDRARFNALKERINNLCKPENKHVMFNKAQDKFQQAFHHLYTLQNSDHNLTTIRLTAYALVTTVLHSIALLNQTYFTKGWGQNMGQVHALKIKPKNLDHLLNQIITQRDISEITHACETLTHNTHALFLAEEKNLCKPKPFADIFSGFHEEVTGLLNKIISACDRQDYATAFFAAVHVQDEICTCLTQTEGFPKSDIFAIQKIYENAELPDLSAIVETGNLTALKQAVTKLDNTMKSLLKSQGVHLNTFDTLDTFQAFIHNK